MEIYIENRTEQQPFISDESVNSIVKTVLEEEGKDTNEPYEMSIVFVTKEEIRAINKEYRNIDRATDVISFAYLEGEGSEFAQFELGDLVISLDMVTDHAKSYGTTLKEELSFMIIHGILHLLGYDHKKESDKNKMQEKESIYLEKTRFFYKNVTE